MSLKLKFLTASMLRLRLGRFFLILVAWKVVLSPRIALKPRRGEIAHEREGHIKKGDIGKKVGGKQVFPPGNFAMPASRVDPNHTESFRILIKVFNSVWDCCPSRFNRSRSSRGKSVKRVQNLRPAATKMAAS